LLLCVVIIGCLAAFAAPLFANTKGRANLANVKSDLHNLASAQEAYFHEHSTYTTDPTALMARVSQGVRLTVVSAGPSGWAATAVHAQSNPITCAVFYGNATPVGPAVTEGVIACQ
jgi:Tfp pilus assembly protein PilE